MPAFKRKKELEKKARTPLLWTAYDRQRAGLLKENKRVNTYAAQKKSAPHPVRLPVEATSSFDPPLRRSVQKSVQRSVQIEPVSRSELLLRPEPLSSRYNVVGEVTHYLDKISVVIIRLFCGLKQGEIVAFEEEKGLFFQKIDSMQMNRKEIKTAKKGDEIGLKVTRKPLVGGRVYIAVAGPRYKRILAEY